MPNPYHVQADQAIQWTTIVNGVATGDADASVELWSRMRGILFFFARRIGPNDAEDEFHNVMAEVVDAIQRGVIREPERIVGFAHTIAKRILAKNIESIIWRRRCATEREAMAIPDHWSNPELDFMRQERAAIATRVLAAIPKRQREILIRFYLQEQDAETIQRELNLTKTQFRLIKSRAKIRYTELMHERMERVAV